MILCHDPRDAHHLVAHPVGLTGPRGNIYLKRGLRTMLQDAVEGVPQRGTLLRRAHELLESIGQPTAESLLIQHLFGVSEGTTGRSAVWTMLLRQTLQSSSLFEQADEQQWSLSAWRSTQLSLNEVEFVVLDTETTGLRPG